MVAGESPVQPHEERDREHPRRKEVDHPHVAEEVAESGLAARTRPGRADQVAGRREHDHRDHHHPVPDAHGGFVDIQRREPSSEHFAARRVDVEAALADHAPAGVGQPACLLA
jgi:hypothetical protein